MSIAFLLTTLVVVATPGTGVVYHSVVRMLVLGGVFILATFVVFAAYGILAASVRSHVTSRPRVLTWLRRTFAGSFLALGAKLAATHG
ncbi:hypothetical protein OG734_33260 [Streptomyces sp. NBC_00576]|nr:hypothetical protein OG734_33260 [Streptomyces sp. NBC_00576]